MDAKRKFQLTAALMVVLLIIFIILLLPGKDKAPAPETTDASPPRATVPPAANRKPVPEEVQAGIAWLQALEAQSPADVEATLKEQRRQERMARMESGELDVWDQLEDAVIMGDSRAVGFWYYDHIPEERVLGDAGHRIDLVPEYYDTLEALNPAQVFFCYGVNDVGIGYWETPEEYAAAMDETVQGVLELLPDTVVYVCSIPEVKDPAFDLNSVWRRIPEYNDAVAAMCAEKGYPYVDCDGLIAEYGHLWDSDGIHFQREVYPAWGQYLAMALYDYENG